MATVNRRLPQKCSCRCSTFCDICENILIANPIVNITAASAYQDPTGTLTAQEQQDYDDFMDSLVLLFTDIALTLTNPSYLYDDPYFTNQVTAYTWRTGVITGGPRLMMLSADVNPFKIEGDLASFEFVVNLTWVNESISPTENYYQCIPYVSWGLIYEVINPQAPLEQIGRYWAQHLGATSDAGFAAFPYQEFRQAESLIEPARPRPGGAGGPDAGTCEQSVLWVPDDQSQFSYRRQHVEMYDLANPTVPLMVRNIIESITLTLDWGL